MRRVDVEVDVHFDINGKMFPSMMTWEDGRVFVIERILDIRQAASLKAGGQGIRYQCCIANKEMHLWFENPKWFALAEE